MKHSLVIIIVFLMLMGCREEVLPKPKAMLRLDFPNATYEQSVAQNFTFDLNKAANLKKENANGFTIEYPLMKGSIYVTYKPIKNNIKTLLNDAQKLSYEHAVKADNIVEQPFINDDKRVYGMFYEITGNAASQSQFYATDSLNHFVTGSLYFYTRPNYDSILPAAMYLQNDIRRIMESLEWKD